MGFRRIYLRVVFLLLKSASILDFHSAPIGGGSLGLGTSLTAHLAECAVNVGSAHRIGGTVCDWHDKKSLHSVHHADSKCGYRGYSITYSLEMRS